MAVSEQFMFLQFCFVGLEFGRFGFTLYPFGGVVTKELGGKWQEGVPWIMSINTTRVAFFVLYNIEVEGVKRRSEIGAKPLG